MSPKRVAPNGAIKSDGYKTAQGQKQSPKTPSPTGKGGGTGGKQALGGRAAVQRAPMARCKQKRTVFRGTRAAKRRLRMQKGGFWGSILLFGLFTLVSYWCGWGIPRSFWRWTWGIFAPTWAAVCSVWTVWTLHDLLWCDYWASGTVWLAVETTANFVLLALFRAAYKVAFVCVGIWSLLGCALLICLTFFDNKRGWGWAQVGEGALVLVLATVGLLCF
ncbi:MAG: hypothetical protein IJY63_04695 [Clostridia bacterium]|nr:hypothetical protein [Clostridia bacterium]